MKALVVGAGMAGAVAARELAEAGWKVLVIDKRNHIAGNAYDFVNEHGIRVHKYGPHLWHGNSDTVQEWVSRFTEWEPYKHKVRALLEDGTTTPLPINAETIRKVFGREFSDFVKCGDPSTADYWGYQDEEADLEFYYKPAAYEAFLDRKRETFYKINNSRQHVEASVGKELCELFFAPYTKKMWGMDLADLPTSVAARIPTKTDSDPYYFPRDKYQGLPKDGYTAMFEKIFDHTNIEVFTGVERQELLQYADPNGCVRYVPGWQDAKFDAVFTSEPIDTYYNCDLGELPWRSIKCHTYSVPIPSMLDSAVINFTHDGPHTRVTEWKKLPNHGDNQHWTTITVEEPCDYKDNNLERYYPVKTSHQIDENRELYHRYRERALLDKVNFIGRCGRYIYTDMSPCVAQTLVQVRRFLRGEDANDE